MGSAAVWPARLRGLVILAGFGVAGAALAGPPREGYLHGSIYPWWTWILVGAGVAAGSVLLIAPFAGRRAGAAATTAACVAVVAGAQLAGTGIVARQHWKPASGMAGYGQGQMHAVQVLAVVLALAAAVAVLAATWQLLADRALSGGPRDGAGWVQVVVGVVLLLVLPFVLGAGEPMDFDLTTWGAAGLIYAGPWGVAVVASAWGTRLATTVLLAAVLGCAVLAALGPQMVDLLALSVDTVFAGVALVVLLVLAVAAGRGSLEPSRS